MTKTLTESMRETINLLEVRNFDPSEYDDPQALLNAFLSLSEQERLQVMQNFSYSNVLFPSGWSYEFRNVPYPKELAPYVIKANRESFMDIAHIYYSGRKLSDGAIQIFKNDAMRPGDPAWQMSMEDLIDDTVGGGYFGGVADHNPEFFKAACQANLSDADCAELLAAVGMETPGDEF